ncbi:HD domain-containing protein [Thermodesulfobacterium sp. TA1]|uniref:HD domain-containing protein n=1 Tax=Thermodesulfobacterium sp. TA1 TaxID=2234087 RepID=UPI00123263F8|nr:HD domain-containing protein [Thermodesulfobacterium sp. TA1]QER41818.1 HD domain-containing protein [Thermodesulfobacterium sp. TA1]
MKEFYSKYANLLFEVAFLKRIERTGYPYLGTGRENVASHSFGVVFIAWILSSLSEEKVDKEKLFKMALLHDLPETRTGDFNALNKLYNRTDEKKALEDAFEGMSLSQEVLSLWQEYRALKSLEAKLVHDADVIDLIIQLKEQKDLNNPYAQKWIDYAKPRLITEVAKKLVEAILETDWCSWWYDFLIEKNGNHLKNH